MQSGIVMLHIMTNNSISTGLILLAPTVSVGYETNLRNNINRKHTKYKELIEEQKKKFPSVIFINLSISALGVFDEESAAFINMLESMHSDKSHVKNIIKKLLLLL